MFTKRSRSSQAVNLIFFGLLEQPNICTSNDRRILDESSDRVDITVTELINIIPQVYPPAGVYPPPLVRRGLEIFEMENFEI